MRSLALAVVIVLGSALVVHAEAPPRSDQAREAIARAQRLHASLQSTLSPEAEVPQPAAPGRAPRRGGFDGGPARRTAQVPAPSVDLSMRERLHVERSLEQISRRLDQADRIVERNPAHALNRVDVAVREMEKVARRLGLRLQEVQR